VSTLISPRPRSRSDQDWPGYVLPVRAPLRLDCGIDFGPFTIAYQTYGTLNPDRSNAILVCHALTGDQYAADPHPLTGKPGWWETLGRDGCSTQSAIF
jgi:homoserine O-acetyltransferase